MADPVPAEEKQDDLADALIDALTDYRCFRHEIDNFDDDDLADLKKHLTEAANPTLRAARENALEEAAVWCDGRSDDCHQAFESAHQCCDEMFCGGQSQAYEAASKHIRSLKSPSSANTKGEGNG